MAPVFVVVMGVCGTGKSTLGAALADALHLPYVDGDDLHPRSNVEKMARGVPLDDTDRMPWLSTIRARAEQTLSEEKEYQQNEQREGDSDGKEQERARRGVVIACSALKRVYRDELRGRGGPTAATLPTYFVFIEGSREVLMERMEKRSGHFMKAAMLDSQQATLESPRGEEGVVCVSMEDSTAAQVEVVVQGLSAQGIDRLIQ
ncbi:P-loop containing nucleoside triphosphate hydrolase protein [Mycena belliarum]|uniref:gluconokinase n=1 Tax=Mycena belliarum TaxID=1033014 RepID=A0AAD6TT61_9AGAR|nr:P-loop containing nucleoside triphosphate hydrolase protein [Mycena belliae]